VSVLEYGSRVQIVFQSSSSLAGPETHPMHLHGQSFYVVATGLGNFDEASNVQMNLVDPPLRNTVVVPSGGWTVIRFVANNPGTYKNHTRNFVYRCPVPLKTLLAAISMSLSVPADLDQSIV
jgi:laccase